MPEMTAPRWLLLLHQLPARPPYLRVKIWRRLGRLGAVPLRNAVYVLPVGEQAREDLQWIAKQIVDAGGEATIVEARLLDGRSDADLEDAFRRARDDDYAGIATELRALKRRFPRRSGAEAPADVVAELDRLARRLTEVEEIDFFGAPGREAAAGLLESLQTRSGARARARPDGRRPRGSTWVTRKDIHVDRIASAWLIRRFVDPDATFEFVPHKGYQPENGELRFDMYEAEYGHEGDRCTFETLCRRFALEDSALHAIAEIVHDLDLKDGKYGRAETPGVASMVAGIIAEQPDDAERLERGAALFDHLHAAFSRRTRGANPTQTRP